MKSILVRWKVARLKRMLARFARIQVERENERLELEQAILAEQNREERQELEEVRESLMDAENCRLRELKTKIFRMLESVRAAEDGERMLSGAGIDLTQLEPVEFGGPNMSPNHQTQSKPKKSVDLLWRVLRASITVTIVCGFAFLGCSLSHFLRPAAIVLQAIVAASGLLTLVLAVVWALRGIVSIWATPGNRSLGVRIALTTVHVISVILLLIMILELVRCAEWAGGARK